MKTMTLQEFREYVRWWYSAPVDGSGLVTQTERRCLISLAHRIRARRIVEIGVSEGRTARAILKALPDIETYYGLDVGPGYPVPESQRHEVPAVAGSLVNDYRFTVMLDDGGWRSRYVPGFPDLVFIDGDHSRGAVLDHTRAAIPRSGECVTIVWHDVGNRNQPGVDAALVDIENDLHIMPTRIHGTSLAFAWVRVQGDSVQ